jgi:protein TonB
MSNFQADALMGVRFSFQLSHKRSAGALGVSLAIHAVMIVLALFIATRAVSPSAISSIIEPLNAGIVWLDAPGPGGGGGGGGNRSKEPVRRVELKGEQQITVPVARPPSMEMPNEQAPEPDPIQSLAIPAQSLESGKVAVAGAMDGVPALGSLGAGHETGAGTGDGGGIGPGRGPGLGEGERGNFGGGPRGVGSGVRMPSLLREVKPQYTAEAMRAKIQGAVRLECVVLADGTVGHIRVTRSLDSAFGLDQEAINAARQWRFAPGTMKGVAVAVPVTIEIHFTLR